MNILTIGSDRNLFESDTAVRTRVVEYGKLFDSMSIIVFTTRSPKYKVSHMAPNVTVYPTRSLNRLFYVWDAILLGRKIKTFDVVSAQDPFESGIVAWVIAKISESKLHIQVHTDLFDPNFKKESFLNKIRVLLAKFLLPKAGGIRVVSERIKRTLVGRGIRENKITVLPIYVDVEKIANQPVKTDLKEKYRDRYIILMASRLTVEKNIQLAIRAIQGLFKSPEITKNLLLLIVGDGPEKIHLEEMVMQYGLTQHVMFESWTSDLISYLKTCDVFLLTSNYEGYGMTLVEAAASGALIVSSNVGISSEIVPPGHLFTVGDNLDLENKLTEAIIGRLDAKGKNLSLSKHYSWEEYLLEYKKSCSL
ncbi:MAG: glycosyltransferase [Candidatus Vogelbacteria bacterium]|nr:glycosyltransferase [Candidatus Vogelbacteria bacterium]